MRSPSKGPMVTVNQPTRPQRTPHGDQRGRPEPQASGDSGDSQWGEQPWPRMSGRRGSPSAEIQAEQRPWREKGVTEHLPLPGMHPELRETGPGRGFSL